MQIEINTRLYNDISQWCEANGFETLKYIERTLRERIAIDKYGDLNEKVQKELEVEVKKPKSEIAKKQEPLIKENKDETINLSMVQDEEVEPITIDNKQEEIQSVEKKKKRTLKIK